MQKADVSVQVQRGGVHQGRPGLPSHRGAGVGAGLCTGALELQQVRAAAPQTATPAKALPLTLHRAHHPTPPPVRTQPRVQHTTAGALLSAPRAEPAKGVAAAVVCGLLRSVRAAAQVRRLVSVAALGDHPTGRVGMRARCCSRLVRAPPPPTCSRNSASCFTEPAAGFGTRSRPRPRATPTPPSTHLLVGWFAPPRARADRQRPTTTDGAP